jgi:hypothetical protein
VGHVPERNARHCRLRGGGLLDDEYSGSRRRRTGFPAATGKTRGYADHRGPGRGTYGVTGAIVSETPGRPGLADANGTIAAVPTLVVDHPGISLTFDARRARKVDAVVDASGSVPLETQVIVQHMIATSDGPLPSTVGVVGGERNDTFAIPVRGDARVFAFGYQAIRTARRHGTDVTYFLAIPTLGQIPADPRFRVRDHDLHRTEASYHAQGVDAAIADRIEFPFFLPGQSASSTTVVRWPCRAAGWSSTARACAGRGTFSSST